MATQNIAVKLCGILQSQSDEEVTAREWRLLGQEQDGSQVLSWVSDKDGKVVQNIGAYTNRTKSLVILHTFEEPLNIIQASVNATRTLLIYVVKKLPTEESEQKEALYCPYLICMLPDKNRGPEVVEEGSTKQIMLQYVYGKSNKYSPGIRNDRFLLFKHLEYIKIYRTPMFLNECDDGTEKWGFDGIYTEPEKIVKVFSWAQWDCVNQILYYIHYRQPSQSFAEGEEVKSPCEMTPTLSAFQFHADLPYETVLNIPLSLPHVSSVAEGAACGAYEDDNIPLRVHDCSLDLCIITDQKGILCICHHYLYKPLDDSTTSLVLEDSVDLKDSGVNFAYSITVLQHGCVIHTVVPDLPWSLAKSLRPSYMLYSDTHLVVKIPQLYSHLIDVCAWHAPGGHCVVAERGGPALAPLAGWAPGAALDPATLDVHTLAVTHKDLAHTFRTNNTLQNRLAILHFLILHEGNIELADELVSWATLRGALSSSLLQEYLVAAAHAHTRRALPHAAAPLLAMLPYTMHLKFADVKVGGRCVQVSQESVWGGAAVVLAPRQRVCQFSEDVWTRLWAALHAAPPPRLRPHRVRDKLAHTLHCYQPEALSRCTTPLSPLAGPPVGLPQRRSSVSNAQDSLPFYELDICTASKQEHVIAANMREASVHLLGGGAGGAGGAGAGEAGGVHACVARWAGGQLDAARALCRALLRPLHATLSHAQPRGFTFIDELEPTHAYIILKVLEQYYLAVEALAFPLPQGFSSFFTYLGYRTLPFHAFVQYVHRNVFELQIDVMKAIVTCRDDDQKQTVNNKLRLIQLAGEGRARRALAAWGHGAALELRARDHAHTLLTGDRHHHAREHARHTPGPDSGIAALPSGERLSPLDTFLDLLTAKASLNELDFNLIIEATLASVQQDTAT